MYSIAITLAQVEQEASVMWETPLVYVDLLIHIEEAWLKYLELEVEMIFIWIRLILGKKMYKYSTQIAIWILLKTQF